MPHVLSLFCFSHLKVSPAKAKALSFVLYICSFFSPSVRPLARQKLLACAPLVLAVFYFCRFKVTPCMARTSLFFWLLVIFCDAKMAAMQCERYIPTCLSVCVRGLPAVLLCERYISTCLSVCVCGLRAVLLCVCGVLG